MRQENDEARHYTPISWQGRQAYRNARRATALGVGFVLALWGASSTADTVESEEQEVLQVVTALFDGMREKDEDLLRSVFLPSASLGDTPADAFVTQVVGSKAYLDERTYDETVLIDGDLAMAWTPYNIFVDGTFHHCGVDVFVMHRTDGLWKIRYLDDTRRTEGCDELATGDP